MDFRSRHIKNFRHVSDNMKVSQNTGGMVLKFSLSLVSFCKIMWTCVLKSKHITYALVRVRPLFDMRVEEDSHGIAYGIAGLELIH